MNEQCKWYVAHVFTGSESQAAQALHSMHAVVPAEYRTERKQGRMTTRLHSYLPGYVFLRTCMDVEDYYTIMNTPGVIRLLKGHVPEDEMQLVLGLTAHGNTGAPAPIAIKDGRAYIKGGPLAELRPTIARLDRRNKRAALRIPILNESHTVTVSVDI